MINTKLFLNNKYFFDTCIGHGIYGNVWLAHDTENNIYAIKFIIAYNFSNIVRFNDS